MVDALDEYDDLSRKREVLTVDAEEFDALVEAEAFRHGTVAIATVLDEEGRVLLCYNEDDGCWMLPGGTVEPHERPSEAAVREVREETGVDIVPERPHAVNEVVRTDGDRQSAFEVVTFEAAPRTTDVDDDLGLADEPISEAGWFEELPDEVFGREHAERMLERLRSD